MTKPDIQNEVQAALDAVLPEFLKVSEAAAMLRLHSRTLDRYRIIGGGPAYYMFGTAVVYALADSRTGRLRGDIATPPRRAPSDRGDVVLELATPRQPKVGLVSRKPSHPARFCFKRCICIGRPVFSVRDRRRSR